MDLAEYLADLEQQVEEGLLSPHELDAIRRRLGVGDEMLTVSYRPIEDHEYVLVDRLLDRMYREEAERPRSQEDVLVSTEVVSAWRGGQLIGAAWYALAPTPAFTNAVYLEFLYTLADHRQEGVGRGLIEEVQEHEPSWPVITYSTQHAADFYRSLGFKDVGGRADSDFGLLLQMRLPQSH